MILKQYQESSVKKLHDMQSIVFLFPRDDFKSDNKAEEKMQKFLQDLIEIEDIKKHLNESGLIKLQR